MLAIVSVLFLSVKKNIIVLSHLSLIVHLFAGEGTRALDILGWGNITKLQPRLIDNHVLKKRILLLQRHYKI